MRMELTFGFEKAGNQMVVDLPDAQDLSGILTHANLKIEKLADAVEVTIRVPLELETEVSISRLGRAEILKLPKPYG